jgi:hypothetical protein
MVASTAASSETGPLSGQKAVAVVWLRIELAAGEAAAQVEAKHRAPHHLKAGAILAGID